MRKEFLPILWFSSVVEDDQKGIERKKSQNSVVELLSRTKRSQRKNKLHTSRLIFSFLSGRSFLLLLFFLSFGFALAAKEIKMAQMNAGGKNVDIVLIITSFFFTYLKAEYVL